MRVTESKNTGHAGYWRFAWTKHKSHEIRQIETKPGCFVNVVGGVNQEEEDLYYPLEESPGISREFSGIRTSSDVIAFADAYGLLGLDVVSGSTSSEVTAFARAHGISGLETVARSAEVHIGEERISHWLSEAAKLREMYLLWDLIASSDEAELAKLFPFKGGERVGSARSRIPVRRKPGELLRIATLELLQMFNRQMEGEASPMLLMDAAGSLHPYNSPCSLLAAMWLEFGEVASGVRKQITCESCGKWMDVTDNRTHKRKHDSCSLREKMARYRKKIREQENGETKTR